MASKPKDRKGTFGDLRLPVARQYLYPARRRRVVIAGGLAAAALLAYSAFDFSLRDAAFLSNGPLSSSHATLQGDCASCHDPFGAVTAESCSTCHERSGDKLGVFTFASHYLYRSNDFQRLVPSEHETACVGCHAEHLGREAQITRVGDGRCLPCHDYGSFTDGHPAFELAAAADDDALAFAHAHHTREVMKRQQLADVERACLHCHNPQPDGRGFEPLSFDRHCDACHLSAGTATPRLPVRDPRQPDAPGVVTLAALVEQPEPGTRWALFTNPNEFRQAGSRLSKSPVHHADPWILENLRRLRRELYPDAGLADLLQTSPDVPAHELATLYREAVATLEDYALGLRSRPEPEVQDELARVDEALAGVKRALEDPYTPLDETELFLALERPRQDLDAERIAEIEELIDGLTQPCQQCHAIRAATVARVQKDQRVLRRAEFNHRAHTLQVRCLECHAQIPILENLENEGTKLDPAVDSAAIQNLPPIEQCRTCHTPELASNRCIVCHQFHPDKSRHFNLLSSGAPEDPTEPEDGQP